MPVFRPNPPKYKKSKVSTAEWKSLRKGLNLLLRPTEISREELAQADNLMLIGSGVPTGRWGTVTYFDANLTGTVRGIGTYKSNDGTTDEIFALTDEGFIAKKDGTSYAMVTGQSWPSGTQIDTEQLGGYTYIVSDDVPLTRYAGSELESFATISAPTGLAATNFSGITGLHQISYKVVQLGINGGHTEASNNYLLTGLPNDLSQSSYKVFWTAASAATYSGFELYRGYPGDETFLAGTPAGVTTYHDFGNPSAESILYPQTNTTGGVQSPIITKYKDRLLCVNTNDPNNLLISGRYPDQESFNWLDGGGSIYIDPDSGDNIIAIEVQPISDRIVVYKNYSSYLVELSLTQVGNYFLLDPTYIPISTSVGCSSAKTVQTVENDTFYFGRSGLYVTGYEPNFLNIIRTNEVSARIRPYLDQLNDDDYTTACAMYADHKYILSFPLKKEMIMYDRERGCFMGPWKFPFGISHMRKYTDSSGTEKYVLGSYDDNRLYEFDDALNSDNGTALSKTLRTGKDYLGDWTRLAIISYFYVLLRNITGTVTVNIYIEDRNGTTTLVKTFTITGSEVNGVTGWGTDMWGNFMWGDTETDDAVVAGDEITRWGSLFKQARLVQIEITTDDIGSNFELLEAKLEATKQGSGTLSSTQRV